MKYMGIYIFFNLIGKEWEKLRETMKMGGCDKTINSKRFICFYNVLFTLMLKYFESNVIANKNSQ